jgi:hypothetical protein
MKFGRRSPYFSIRRKVPLQSAILDGPKETTQWNKVEERTKNECFDPVLPTASWPEINDAIHLFGRQSAQTI